MISQLLNMLNNLGLSVHRYRPSYAYTEHKPGYHYVPNIFGHSAEEQLDISNIEPFGTIARKVVADRRTYLYYDRLYTLYQALMNPVFRGSDNAHVAEVGVFRGGGTYFIASMLDWLGLDARQLHAFDTFQGHDGSDICPGLDDVKVHTARKFSETSVNSVRDYTVDFANVHLHEGRIQDTALEVGDLRFGFVHLDVDLHDPTLFGLEFFGPRLIRGGVIVLDDYDCITCPGIRTAVDSFLSGRNEFVRLDQLTAQCVLIRV